MSRPAISAAAFALTAGRPVDAREVVHVDPEPDARGRRLLASVEPLEPSVRGFELAACALMTLRRVVAAEAAAPPAQALARAFAAANAALLAESRPGAGCRLGRGGCVGVTAAILAGRELLVAQVPPTQAIVVQDRRLYAFPDLNSWRPDFVPTSDDPEPDPLGCREETRPVLYRTVVAPGDLILLCSSSLARRLGRCRAASEALRTETQARGGERAGQLEAALDRLGALAALHCLDDSHAAAIAVGRMPLTFGGGRALRDGFDRLAAVGAGLVRRPPAAEPGRGAGWGGGWETAGARGATATATAVAIPTARSTASTGRARGERWVSVGRPLDRRRLEVGALARARLRGVAGAARRPARVASPNGARPAIGRGVLAAPGAASVQRFTGRSASPAEWRVNLPRGPEIHLPGRLLAVGSLAFAAFGGSGVALEQYFDRAAQVRTAFATVDASLQALATGATAADPVLAEADRALADARAAGARGQPLAARQWAIEAERDGAWRIDRLRELSRVGALPAGVDGSSSQLVRAGERLFLVEASLYEIDVDAGRLVRLLGPGDRVGDEVVGRLRTAAADAGGVVVGDGLATYARDAAGNWSRRPLALADGNVPWPEMPTALYQGNLYALVAPGEILKFSGETPAAADVWADADGVPALSAARDLAIDGRINVLLGDGRVQRLYRGLPEATITPEVSPPVADPIALADGARSGSLYLLDAGARIGPVDGRVLRLSPGGETRQLLPPTPSEGDAAADEAGRALAAARDLVVDEAAGVMYVVTEREIWRGVLPGGSR